MVVSEFGKQNFKNAPLSERAWISTPVSVLLVPVQTTPAHKKFVNHTYGCCNYTQ